MSGGLTNNASGDATSDGPANTDAGNSGSHQDPSSNLANNIPVRKTQLSLRLPVSGTLLKLRKAPIERLAFCS